MAHNVNSSPPLRLPALDSFPWDEWLDGSVWELTAEEDYPGMKDSQMRSFVYRAARARDIPVTTKIPQDGGSVRLQARPVMAHE